MPFVRRKIDEEKLIPDWLRKAFGFAASAPPARLQVVMPAPVRIPLPAAFAAQGELKSIAAVPVVPSDEPGALAFEALGEFAVHKPLVLKRPAAP
jgi:hypothetical protein